jgi:hypothetical protein
VELRVKYTITQRIKKTKRQKEKKIQKRKQKAFLVLVNRNIKGKDF